MQSLRAVVCAAAVAVVAACAGRQSRPSLPAGTADTAPLPAGIRPYLQQTIPLDRALHHGTLANGMRYLIRRNQRPESRLELRLVVRVGSVVEADHEQGFAHVLEHLAFQSTRHFGGHELVQYLESLGIAFGPDLNAYTGFDATVYELRVPTDSAAVVQTALQVLADWAGGMLLLPEEVDRERQVIIEEWRSGRGAAARLRDQQLPLLLSGSRYAERLPMGQLAVLDTFHHEQLRSFHRAWYRPDLMAVIAVGDCDPAWLLEQIRDCFGALAAAPDAPARPEFPVPPHAQTLFSIATDPEATAAQVALYTKADARLQATVGDYRRYLVELLYYRMLNQRLYELTMLAEPPFLSAAAGNTRLVATAEAQVLRCQTTNAGVLGGLAALVREARRARLYGFTATELEREKKDMLRYMDQVYRERDKTESATYAAEYIRHFLDAEPTPGLEYEYGLYRTFLPQITREEVAASAAQWNAEANRVVLVSMSAAVDVAVPTEAMLRRTLAEVEAETIEPYIDAALDGQLVEPPPSPGRIVHESTVPELGLTVWELSNGVRVKVKPTDFKNDEVLLAAVSPGGHSLVDDADFIAASTADAVVRESGVGRYDKIALEKALAGRMVQVVPWIGELQEGLKGAASPEDLETLFQLVYLYMVEPRADSTAFASYQHWLAGMIENRAASPDAAFSDTVTAILSQHHLRARPWSPEMIAAMDLQRSLAIYRQRMAAAGDFTFYLVGNLDLEELRGLVCRYLGALPAGGPGERWRDVGIDPPPGVVEREVRRGLEQKCFTQIIFAGERPWSYEEAFALDALAAVLRIRLREVLREGLGGTYGVGVGGTLLHYPDEEYRLAIGFGCAPERLEELTGAVFAQLDSMALAGPDTSLIERVRSVKRRQHEVELRENSYWLELLQAADFHGLEPQRVLELDRQLAELSPDLLRGAAARYVDKSRYVRVVLRPETDASQQ